MARDILPIVSINTIAQSHQLLGIGKPKHPLFSLLKFEDLAQVQNDKRIKLMFDFYHIILKRDCPGKVKYGQTQYDFDEGVMSFFAPKQLNIIEPGEVLARSGWLLNIHPDFFRAYALAHKIKDYRFFGYATNESLILSQEEEQDIVFIFQQIDKEYHLPIDRFSQDVVIANIELLLTYSNRYYNRQFITRKIINNDLLDNFNHLLKDWFANKIQENGAPTVSHLASQLHISPKYLSDCLKQISGQSAQQLIQNTIIEKAKEKLSTTPLSVSEIAYELGFEHSQSFSKLFKQKTEQSPLEFRAGFN